MPCLTLCQQYFWRSSDSHSRPRLQSQNSKSKQWWSNSQGETVDMGHCGRRAIPITCPQLLQGRLRFLSDLWFHKCIHLWRTKVLDRSNKIDGVDEIQFVFNCSEDRPQRKGVSRHQGGRIIRHLSWRNSSYDLSKRWFRCSRGILSHRW